MTDADALDAAIERQWDNWRQMTDQSGPVYTTAKERSRAVAEVYRAAGSPPRVTSGPEALLYAPWKAKRNIVPATPEQAAAWRAWVVERERLRRELRDGKATYVDAATAKAVLGIETGDD